LNQRTDRHEVIIYFILVQIEFSPQRHGGHRVVMFYLAGRRFRVVFGGDARQIKTFYPFKTLILPCIRVSCSFCDSIPEGIVFMIQSPSPACAAEAATVRRRPDWIIKRLPLCPLCLCGETAFNPSLINELLLYPISS
jgi:hypothetical protein